MTTPTAIEDEWEEEPAWVSSGVFEAADHGSGMVLLRDATDKDRPLVFSPFEWRKFLSDVRAGVFDGIGRGPNPVIPDPE